MALIGVRRTLIKPKAAVFAGTPPTFTFRDSQPLSGSGSGPYTVSMAAGAAFSNRRLYALLPFNTSSASAIASSSIGGVPSDVAIFMGSGGGAQSAAIISAVVPTGTTATVSITFTGAPSSLPNVTLFSVDTTTLISTTPTTNVLHSSSVSSITSSIVTSANGVLLMLTDAFGGTITGGTMTITSSDSGMSQVTSNAFDVCGLANNVASSGANHVAEGWTGSTDATMWLLALR